MNQPAATDSGPTLAERAPIARGRLLALVGVPLALQALGTTVPGYGFMTDELYCLYWIDGWGRASSIIPRSASGFWRHCIRSSATRYSGCGWSPA